MMILVIVKLWPCVCNIVQYFRISLLDFYREHMAKQDITVLYLHCMAF